MHHPTRTDDIPKPRPGLAGAFARVPSGSKRLFLSGTTLRISFLLLATCLGLAGCAGPQWNFNPGAVFQEAAARDQLVLVYYRTAMCQYSANMDRRVFTDPQVRERLGEFLLLQRDYALWRNEAAKLGITGTPGFIVHRPNGSVVGTPAVGEMSAAEFRAFLATAKLQR